MKNLAARLVLISAALCASGWAMAQSTVTEVRCSTAAGTNCSGQIPDAPITTGLTSTISVPGTQCALGLRAVAVRLEISHEAVGDLRVRLTSPGGTQAIVLDDLAGPSGVAGSCLGDDVNAVFGAAGAPPTCGALIPAVSGSPRAVGNLIPLGVETATTGTWTLDVFDDANDNTGFLNDWALQSLCIVSTPLPGPQGPWLILALIGVATLGSGLVVRRR